MSCARIAPSDFDSAAAAAYTTRSVHALTRSKSFAAYMRHLRYRDRLSLIWFIVPLGVAAAVCYHLIVFGVVAAHDDDGLYAGAGNAHMQHYRSDYNNNNNNNDSRDDASEAFGLPYVAMGLAMYLLPCVLIAPHLGFFDDDAVSWRDSVVQLLCASLVHVLVCMPGSERWWHAPLLQTHPPSRLSLLAALSHTTPATRLPLVWSVARTAALRALPLQGMVVASFVVSVWQRTFWRRYWHIPLPLLTVPLLVGAAGALCWLVTLPLLTPPPSSSSSLSYASLSLLTMPRLQDVTHRAAQTVSWLYSTLASSSRTPPAAYSAAQRVAMWAWRALAQHRDAVERAVAHLAHERATMYNVYITALLLVLAHVAALLLRGVVAYVLGGLLRLLPTQPTLWVVVVLGSASALGMQLYSTNGRVGDALLTPRGASTLALLGALLYNGFVA